MERDSHVNLPDVTSPIRSSRSRTACCEGERGRDGGRAHDITDAIFLWNYPVQRREPPVSPVRASRAPRSPVSRRFARRLLAR
jgi:hypothetical protein